MTTGKLKLAYLEVVQITVIIVISLSVILPFLFYLMTEASIMEMVREGLSIMLTFSLLTALIAGVIFLSDRIPAKLVYSVARHLFEVLAVILVSFFLLRFSYNLMNDDPSPGASKMFLGLNLLGTAFIYLFQKGLYLKQKAAEKIHETEVLRKDFNLYRLHALKNQVNPHFLFNSLSVLSSLVYKDADLAEKFVVRLSEAYLYILNQKETELVSLKEELKFLKSYFFLMQIRFDNKLQLDIHIDAAEDLFVPPLILQLLLENAIKHNRMSASRPLKVTLRREGMFMIIENNVYRRELKEGSTGLGLENIRNRYLMMGQSEIAIISDNAKFMVKIPLLTKYS